MVLNQKMQVVNQDILDYSMGSKQLIKGSTEIQFDLRGHKPAGEIVTMLQMQTLDFGD